MDRMSRWLWFAILVWLSFIAGAFLYNSQPLYIAIFTVFVPLFALYLGAMARLFSWRPPVRTISMVGVLMLAILCGGEAWVRSLEKAEGRAVGLLPLIVQTFEHWKQPTAPNLASQPAADAQIVASRSNREILDALANVITEERCGAWKRDLDAGGTGWSTVLMPDRISSVEKIQEGKLSLDNYRKLINDRLDIFKRADANGQALIKEMVGDARDKSMQQFSSAENMIVRTQSDITDAKDLELQIMEKMLDISLHVFARSPGRAQRAMYTSTEAARWNALMSEVAGQDSRIKKIYDGNSYELKYADQQLDLLVKPLPGSRLRDTRCHFGKEESLRLSLVQRYEAASSAH